MSDDYDTTALDPAAIATAMTCALEPFWEWVGVDIDAEPYMYPAYGPAFTGLPSAIDAEDHGEFVVRPMHTDEPSQYPWTPMPHASDDHLATPLWPSSSESIAAEADTA